MTVFESPSGIPIAQTTTEGGDHKFLYADEARGVELELVLVRGRRRWVQWTTSLEGGGATALDLDPQAWPCPRDLEDPDAARAIVEGRVA